MLKNPRSNHDIWESMEKNNHRFCFDCFVNNYNCQNVRNTYSAVFVYELNMNRDNLNPESEQLPADIEESVNRATLDLLPKKSQ